MSKQKQPVEIVSARTVNTKILSLPNGKRKVITSVAPKHYLDKGKYVDLDTTIAVKNDRFTADQLPFEFRIYRDGIGYDYTSKVGGTISVVLDSVGGSKINGEQFFVGERTGSEVLFRDVAEGLDLRFVVHKNGIRTYRILKSDRAAKEWVWRITGDEAGLSKISSRISGKDASGKELAGLTLSINDGVAVEAWDGTAIAVSRDRIPSLTTNVQYPVTIDPDVTEVISGNLNDASLSQTGYPNPYDSRISWSTVPYRNSCFFRFLSVAVDQGETIALAELKLTITSVNCNGVIYGLDYDSAPAVTALGGYAGATRTTASTTFTPGGTGLHTADVTSIVQEIVDRGGWVTGADLGFVIDPTSSAGYTRFEDVSDGGSGEAQLEITFGAAGNRRRRLLLGT